MGPLLPVARRPAASSLPPGEARLRRRLVATTRIDAVTWPEESSLARFLEDVAAATPAPGAGSVSAVAAALAAALAAMAARFSGAVMADAAEIAAEADRLRGEVLLLARIDGESYEAVLAALRRPRDDPEREAALGQALSDAAEPPLAIAELAADAGELAARVADGGNGHLLGDAAAGAYLAQAAALACANLVRINLRGRPGDARIVRVEAAVARAAASTRAV